MSRGIFIFGIWCLLIVSAFAYASFAGYSPFADGKRASSVRGVGAGVILGRGPRGK